MDFSLLLKNGLTFSRVEAITEGDDADALRLQHPVNLCKDLLRLLEVLHADTAQDSIKGRVC